MALIRRHVVIGYNDDGTEITKRIQGKDENELNDKTVQAYIDSGRIWEFLDKPALAAPPKQTKTLFKTYPAFMADRINLTELARLCRLSRPTVYKYLKLLR